MSKPGEITIAFDTDKLDAINQFCSASDLPLEEELAETAEKIYAKRVPLPVRQFIEKRPVPPPKPRKPAPKQAAPTGQQQ